MKHNKDKQQRDEARKQRDELRDSWWLAEGRMKQMLNEIESLRKERDTLLNIVTNLVAGVDRSPYILRWPDLIKAREALDSIPKKGEK